MDEPPAAAESSGARKRRAGPEEDPFSDMGIRPDDPFDGSDWTVEDIEEADESVWEELSTEPTVTTEEEGGRRVSEVNKHSFCEGCEYFTGPPEIACTHPGTEIRAFLDMKTVEVVDCPIVEEREQLENAGTRG